MSVGRALRAALAATVAWLVVIPWGGLADQYPYYAPMGALITVTTTVAGAWRESWRMAAAMALGAVLALVTTPLPGLVQLAVVVGLGTFISGWDKLGANASWVPISGLFVLLFGQGEPWGFPAAYVGLTALGGVIGLIINALWPPLPLNDAEKATSDLRDVLRDQLEVLADTLADEALPSEDEWQERVHDIEPALARMRELVSTAEDSRRANWRAGRWQDYGDTEERRARALDVLAFLVEDLTWLLTDREHAGRDEVALGPELRPLTADVLQRLADVLGSMDGSGADSEELDRADAALDHLVTGIRKVHSETGEDTMAASGVVSTVRRTLDTLR